MAILHRSRLKLKKGKGPLWADLESSQLFHFDHWPSDEKKMHVFLLGKTYQQKVVEVVLPNGDVERRSILFHKLGAVNE